MADEIKPVPFGLAAGIVIGVGSFFMGMGMGSHMIGYGYGSGMMGMMSGSGSYTLFYSFISLIMGFFIGLLGGFTIAWLYNYFARTMKEPGGK